MTNKVQNFFSEVVVELKKVSWSSRRELIDATVIVLISTACLGVFIGVIDFVLSKFVQVIIG